MDALGRGSVEEVLRNLRADPLTTADPGNHDRSEERDVAMNFEAAVPAHATVPGECEKFDAVLANIVGGKPLRV
jgi:hypothetical protein